MPRVDRSWTLFLDRDGVINVEKPMDYVRAWEEFQFNPGVLKALKLLNGLFGRIVVVTNQRGVGKGLMTEQDLLDIHDRMTEEIVRHLLAPSAIAPSRRLPGTARKNSSVLRTVMGITMIPRAKPPASVEKCFTGSTTSE